MKLVAIIETKDYDTAREVILDNLTNPTQLFLMDYHFKDHKMIYRVLEYELYSNNSIDLLLNAIEKIEKVRKTKYFNIFFKNDDTTTLIEREL